MRLRRRKKERVEERRALSRAPCEFSLKSVIKAQRVLSAFLLRLPPVTAAVTVDVMVAAPLTSRSNDFLGHVDWK